MYKLFRKEPLKKGKGDKDSKLKKKEQTKKKPMPMWWEIGTLIEKEGLADVPVLLAHAWGGCDTTSSLHRRGKIKILQYLKSEDFIDSVETFGILNSSVDDIKHAGIRMALKVYGGKADDTLSSLRYARFKQMVAENSKFQPENLPPTERAILYHSLRVHLQVCIWKELNLRCLDPREWGWKMFKGALCPIKTDQDAAPQYLLKVIRCKCKTSSTNTCGERTLCSCRTNGLPCVSACGDCRGISCCNVADERIGIEMDDMDFDE